MDALPPINCSFECESIPAPFTVWEAKLTEGLSKPFVLELVLRTDVMAVHPEMLIGRSCSLHIDRAQVMRSVHGIVEEVEVVGDVPMAQLDAQRVVKLTVVPAFKLLEHRKNSRIFQDMTVLQIVKDVLLGETAEGGSPEGLVALGRTYDASALRTSDYDPARDYCVQYKESDFAFVSRLLEEEGIAYQFEHMRINHEVMVLHDSNITYPQIETVHGAPFLRVSPLGDLQLTEGVAELSWKRVKKTDRTVLRHWDWLTPREGSENTQDRDSAEDSAASAAGAGLEQMPAGAPITSYVHSDERSREESQSERLVRVHGEGNRRGQLDHQREKAEEWVAHGKSNALGLGSGRIFEHDGDGVHSVLVTSVVHTLKIESGTGENAQYGNEFEAIPVFRAFRPQKVQKRPKIEGPQTAIVTGPQGEEIHTDEHGRIKILMHWDRDGEGGRRRQQRHDASSSVFVRVAQMVAGPGWGTWFLPRVGMEVVVQFLDGNPDRPLVAGCVYNGENRTPYPLPEEKTKSTIKTQSSPGGGGYNELRFEDAAGTEEVWLHGQRDYNSVIERRHTMHVGENQSYNIVADRTRDVGGNETVHVVGNQSITVDGQGEGGFKGITVNVVETYKLDASKNIAEQAPEMIQLICQGSMIEMTPGRIVLRAGDGAEIVLDKNVLATSNDQSRLLMDADIKADAKNGARLALEDKATLQDTNGSKIVLDSKITIESCDGAKSEYDDKIKSQAPQEIDIIVEQTTMKFTANETELDSPQIALRGVQTTEIEGGGGRATFSGGKASLN
jgi:type VI secretion system secreted protein VgrG